MPAYFVAKSVTSIFTGQTACEAQLIATLRGSPSMLMKASGTSESLSEAEAPSASLIPPSEKVADVDVEDVTEKRPSDSMEARFGVAADASSF